MKKQLLRMGLLAAVFTVLLCVGALAADPTESGIYDVQKKDSGVTVTPAGTASGATIGGKDYTDFYAGAEKMSVTLSSTEDDVINDGEQYVIFVTNTEDVPWEGNLVYINQEAAGENGVTFSTVYPSKLENGKTYYVCITGGDRILNETNKTPVATFQYFAPYIMGDANLDGEVTAYDVTVILRHIAKIQQITDNNACLAADVNRSGDVDAGDATKILRYIAKIDPSLD